MTVLKVTVAVDEIELQAARVDMIGTLGTAGKPAVEFVLPGHDQQFYIHSGMQLRVSAIPEEQAALAISARALTKR
jgi:hypothetical protein